MKKRNTYNKANKDRYATRTVDQGENWRIDRVRNDDVVEFSVYIDGVWMADRDTKEEAQSWRNAYVYEQLQRAA